MIISKENVKRGRRRRITTHRYIVHARTWQKFIPSIKRLCMDAFARLFGLVACVLCECHHFLITFELTSCVVVVGLLPFSLITTVLSLRPKTRPSSFFFRLNVLKRHHRRRDEGGGRSSFPAVINGIWIWEGGNWDSTGWLASSSTVHDHHTYFFERLYHV